MHVLLINFGQAQASEHGGARSKCSALLNIAHEA